MKIAKLELFKVPPRWLFLKMTTDDGLVGWGEPVWVVLLICKGLNFTFFQDHEADTVLLRWLSQNNLLLGLLGIKI